MTFQQFLWGVALPALLAAAVWTAASFPLKRESATRAGGSLAFAIGYICAHYGIGAPMTGADAFAWMPWIAAAAGAAGILEYYLRGRGMAVALLQIAVAAGTLQLLVSGVNPAYAPQWYESAAAIVVTAAAWRAVSKAGATTKGLYVPAMVWAACAAGAFLMLKSGSAKNAQLAGALAASAGPAAVLALWMRPPQFEKGASAGFIIIFNCLIMHCVYFGEMPKAGGLALALAPALAAALPAVMAMRYSKTIAILSGVIGGGAALGIAAWQVMASAAPDGY